MSATGYRHDSIAYRCDACPFTTSDPDAKRGHEAGPSTGRGWLGNHERHTMEPRWYAPECDACRSGHHPGTIPTAAEVDAWETEAAALVAELAPTHPADAAAERSTTAAMDWARAKADGDDDGRARALRAYRAARMVGRAFARPEYRHPAAVGAEYRGPTANETAAEDADGDEPEPRPDTVYRVDDGGGMAWSLCGECIAYVLSDSHGATVGAPTADRCRGCGLSGAPARWATANRGADLWRALLVGLDGLEVDPLTGAAWSTIPHQRPGLMFGGLLDALASARWAILCTLSRRGPVPDEYSTAAFFPR